MKCYHYLKLPWNPRAKDGSVWPEGGAVIARLSEDEFLVSGSGVVLEFASKDEWEDVMKEQTQLGEDGFLLQASNVQSIQNVKSKKGIERVGLASVDEVKVLPNGSLQKVRILNGDQTHQGRHVRISVDEYRTLLVHLYRYK